MGGVVVFLFIAIAAAGAIWWFQYQAKVKRRRELFALAQSIGFAFSVDDPHDTCSLPFDLLHKGKRRATENVMWGTYHGLALREFDYWYYDEQSDGRGGRSRTYHRYTCALLTIDAACPGLRIGREGLFSRIGNAMGFKDVELEYDDFNRAFRVKCGDQRFAFSLLDGQMMEWLLGAGSFEALDIVGPWVLIVARKLPTSEWLPLVALAEQFHAHIPRVVFATWPKGAVS